MLFKYKSDYKIIQYRLFQWAVWSWRTLHWHPVMRGRTLARLAAISSARSLSGYYIRAGAAPLTRGCAAWSVAQLYGIIFPDALRQLSHNNIATYLSQTICNYFYCFNKSNYLESFWKKGRGGKNLFSKSFFPIRVGTWGGGKDLLLDRSFSPSSNSTPFFQTFYRHLSFCSAKR